MNWITGPSIKALTKLVPFRKLKWAVFVLCLWGLSVSAIRAENFSGLQKIKRHHAIEISQAPYAGEIETGHRFHLAIHLPLNNQDQLDQLLKDLYDRNSSSYHRFLKPDEYTSRFGPSTGSAQAVADYMKANGLMVMKIHSNRVIVDVEGDLASVEKAFHVKLHYYRRPDGSVFYGPEDDPSMDLETSIQDVSGLENYFVSRHLGSGQRPGPMAMGGSGGGGSNFGIDFRNAYAGNVTLTGSGQSIAFFELSTYYPTDIPVYQAQLPTSNAQAATMYAHLGTLTNIYLDGWTSTTTPVSGGADEVAIDIETGYAMAPAANMRVYMGDDPDDVLNQIATEDDCQQISASWWYPTTGTAFPEFAAQGQSYFNAAGDNGGYTSTVEPNQAGDDFLNINYPDMTIVGGTELTMNTPTYGGEVVWSAGGTTGGGIMDLETIPSYQVGMTMTAIGGSTSDRNAPDVAACAFNIYGYESGGWGAHWGTSFATPMWAGFMALTNQLGTLDSLPSVGFANPVLYSIGQNATEYAADFHDITTGNNGPYSAQTGFDLCTGWGSPNGQSLINDILGIGKATPTCTMTSTQTQTQTATNTQTNTVTATQTNTSTSTSLITSTSTSTNTQTSTETVTSTMTQTNTPTTSGTPTNTGTPSMTGTFTFTPTVTATPTATLIPYPIPYPNPCVGPDFHLKVPMRTAGPLKVEVFTIAYRRIREVNVPSQPVDVDLDLTLKDTAGYDLANGLYYLRVTTVDRFYIVKLLVLR